MTLECDTVLNAVGFRPNNQLEDLLDEKYDEVAVIGDAVAPRKILTAIHEGYHAIRVMEKEILKMISFDLTGKVAVVTGASSGLGQQFARALSEQGCDVAILARRKERLEEFSKELKQNGHDCLPVSCDVTDEESIKNAVKAVVDHFGKIDILVNNAGVVEYSSGLHDHTTAHWDKVLDTDLKGVFLMAREVSTIMMKQKYGRIINISSVGGIQAGPAQVSYFSAKGGVVNLTKAMAGDLAPYGILDFNRILHFCIQLNNYLISYLIILQVTLVLIPQDNYLLLMVE